VTTNEPLGFAIQSGRAGDLIKVFFGMHRKCEWYRAEEAINFGMMVEHGKHGVVPWRSGGYASKDETKAALAKAEKEERNEPVVSKVRKVRPGVLDA
jgi:hypothetical protein